MKLEVNRSLSRRHFLSLAGAAMAGGLLVSCAPKPTPTPPPTAVKVAPTAIPVATKAPEVRDVTISQWWHVENCVEFYKERAELWRDEHPEYKFTFDFQVVPGEQLWTKILANLAAGSGAPDMLGIDIGVFHQFMKGGIADKGLVDLTDWIGVEREKFVEGRWTPFIHNGKIYGVEGATCPCGYWYQPDILEAAGISEPPKTWDDMIDAGKKLLPDKRFVMLTDDTGASTYFMMLMQRGAGIFAEDGTVTIGSPEAIEVAKLLMDGANEEEVFFKAGADNYWGPATWGAFKDGTVAGVIGADWYGGNVLRPALEDMSGKWRLAPLPLWPKGGHKSSTWGGTGTAITKQSEHADLCFDLLHFAQMTVEGQVLRFKIQAWYPTMYEAMEDPRVSDVADEYFGGQKIGAIFATVADDMPTQWQSPFWGPATKALTDQLVRAYGGEIGAEEAINTAEADIKAIVAKGE